MGLAVELVAITPGEQIEIAADHAQRLLQIVRCDVGEAREFGVGSREFGDEAFLALVLFAVDAA